MLVDMGSTPAPAEFASAFEEAKARWEAVIAGELDNYQESTPYGISDWFGGAFHGAYKSAIDDLVIGFAIEYIDGAGAVLGSAGCRYRTGNRCLSGIMRFEKEDLSRMAIEDIKVIILHEMGHVLGLVGTLGPCQGICDRNNMVQYEYGQGLSSGCSIVRNEYNNLNSGSLLFLENGGGGGTACAHWEGDSFSTATSSELMTGWFEAWKYQPISKVTVGALDDLGVFTLD
jgi:Leishmanolysin